MIRLTYALLGLFSFFTAGEDEAAPGRCRRATRPWMRQRPSTDLARGFIRAEVVTYEDLMAAGTMAEAQRGVLRSEGRRTRCGTATLSRSCSTSPAEDQLERSSSTIMPRKSSDWSTR